VVERARAEQAGHGERVDGAGDARLPRRGEDDEQQADDERHEERPLVRHAAKTRLDERERVVDR
jgi:hypothetical protein